MKKRIKIRCSALIVAGLLMVGGAAAQKTTISYGNNLGLTPESQYASQFRYANAAEMHKVVLTPTTHIPAGTDVEWSVDLKLNAKHTRIDPKTGALTLDKGNFRVNNSALVIVHALVGKGTPKEEKISVPVFFSYDAPAPQNEAFTYNYMVKYAPFAVQVNPRTGGASEPVVVSGEGYRPDAFALDYRRGNQYFNLNGPASHEGDLKVDQLNENMLLYQLWENYFNSINKPVNFGDKRPVSYFSNKRDLSLPLCYVDHADGCRVVVNPGKWRDRNGLWANGIYYAQMTYVDNAEAEGINKGQTCQPLFIWFDESF